ncbi:MAG TPA: hypothetical protein VGE34_03240 [Candidatus Saccharimonadales bacterium]
MSEPTKSTPKTSAFNTQPAGLEKALDDLFHKTIKVELPENIKKWIADNAWWIVLVGGILSLLSAFSVWQAATATSRLLDYANQLSASVGVASTSQNIGIVTYVAIAGIVAQAVMMLLAFQQLKEYKKSGWNLMFYTSYISLAIGVVYVFSSLYGVASLIGSLVGVFIGWFFLFQVRKYFTK